MAYEPKEPYHFGKGKKPAGEMGESKKVEKAEHSKEKALTAAEKAATQKAVSAAFRSKKEKALTAAEKAEMKKNMSRFNSKMNRADSGEKARFANAKKAALKAARSRRERVNK